MTSAVAVGVPAVGFGVGILLLMAIKDEISEFVLQKLPADMLKVIDAFAERFSR